MAALLVPYMHWGIVASQGSPALVLAALSNQHLQPIHNTPAAPNKGMPQNTGQAGGVVPGVRQAGRNPRICATRRVN
jgi:hypothetical protein